MHLVDARENDKELIGPVPELRHCTTDPKMTLARFAPVDCTKQTTLSSIHAWIDGFAYHREPAFQTRFGRRSIFVGLDQDGEHSTLQTLLRPENAFFGNFSSFL
jgi:hypothetical protein